MICNKKNKIKIGIRCIFQTFCFLATLTMSIYCFCKYFRDEDVSMITYKHFHHSKNGIYPSFSICFYNPFNEEKLRKYGVNISTYSEYLQGMYWDPKMEHIDYEEVTLQIEDYLCDVTMDPHDLTWIDYKDMKIQHDKMYGNKCHYPTNHSHHQISVPYVHYRSGLNKCFTFDIPYKYKQSVTYFSINLRSGIFPNDLRPSRPDFDVKKGIGSGFYVSFHYPHQFLRADRTIKRTWDPLVHNHDNSSKEDLDYGIKFNNHYEMRFRISEITVSKMRYRSNWQSKAQPNCNPHWKHDDQICMSQLMEEAGCNLPYWPADKKLQTCASMKAIKKVQPLSNVNISQWYPPPCQSIEKIDYHYEEVEIKGEEDSSLEESPWFRIVLLFHAQTYKEISQIKAYDSEMLVGNIGGYLGLFLGYAILQIPALLSKSKKWFVWKIHFLREVIGLEQTVAQLECEKIDAGGNATDKMHSSEESLKVIFILGQLTDRLEYLEKNVNRLSKVLYKINDNLQSA